MMAKLIQSLRDNLRLTAVHWNQSVMDCLGDGPFVQTERIYLYL